VRNGSHLRAAIYQLSEPGQIVDAVDVFFERELAALPPVEDPALGGDPRRLAQARLTPGRTWNAREKACALELSNLMTSVKSSTASACRPSS